MTHGSLGMLNTFLHFDTNLICSRIMLLQPADRRGGCWIFSRKDPEGRILDAVIIYILYWKTFPWQPAIPVNLTRFHNFVYMSSSVRCMRSV